MKLLEIFTITFNRPNELERLYESIKKQTYLDNDLSWFIVVNGYNEETIKKILSWKKEDEIKIFFKIFKNNIGLTRALNYYANTKTRYFFSFRVDDDDILFTSFYEQFSKLKVNQNDREFGYIMDIFDKNNSIIGSKIPIRPFYSNYNLHYKYKVRGDKARIYQKIHLKKYKYPTFKNELYCPDSIIYYRMDEKVKLIPLKIKSIIREYLLGGLTSKSNSLIRKNFNGFFLSLKELYYHDQANFINKLYFLIYLVIVVKNAEKKPKDLLQKVKMDKIQVLIVFFVYHFYSFYDKIKKNVWNNRNNIK